MFRTLTTPTVVDDNGLSSVWSTAMKTNSVDRLLLMVAFSVLVAIPMSVRANDIFRANNHLTFGAFLGALNSDDERLRRDADVYIYGVIDATEKRIWCSFWDIKSSELINHLRYLFKKVDKSRYDERASHVITELLQNRRPCKKAKS